MIQALASDPRSLAHAAELEAPASHRDPAFLRRHGGQARKEAARCTVCHTQESCLDATPGYHPAGFLASHPAAAYTRESSCSDCHNQGQFCANCHLNAGLVSPGRLRGAGYHDAKQSFLLNHGQAARQSLESCMSCHSE